MIKISNFSKKKINKKVFSTVAKKVLSGENRQTDTLSLAFITKEEIKKLNKKFRKKSKATDVLSFELDFPGEKGRYMGEVLICPEVVAENAKKYGHTFKKEIMKVFIHGILHLCGYDHEKSGKDALEMEKKENKYLS